MRGPLVTMVQLLITFGLVLGFFFCYGTALIPSSLSWRLPFALHAIIAAILAVSAYFCLPHSPRWLAHIGRKEEARRTWDKLGVSAAEREKDMLENPAMDDEIPIVASTPAVGGQGTTRPAKKDHLIERLRQAANHMKATFSNDARKPMILGVFLMSMQQLSGIDGVIYVCLSFLAPYILS